MGKSRCNVWAGGLLTFSMLAGCAVERAEPEELVSETQQQIGGFDEEVNGRTLVGAKFEEPDFLPDGATEYFSVSTTGVRDKTTVKLTFIGGATLISSTGGALKDVVLSRTTPPTAPAPRIAGGGGSSSDVHLKIAGAAFDGSISHYALDYNVGDGDYKRACDNAIALYGTLDRTGAHLPTANRITFVCHDGDGAAAAKCALFGYPAGVPGSPLWGAHQACMQMLEADYCGKGIPNTRTGTSIEYYDNHGVYQVPPGLVVPMMNIVDWPPGPDEYYFEAAFRDAHGPAVCNSRARWPLITASCIASIPDCPAATDALISSSWNATMLVASKFNQLKMHRWRSDNGTGDDVVVTVRGYHNPNDGEERPPWPQYKYEGTEGVLLRVPPTIVPAGGILAVAVFRRGANDRFVARADDTRFNAPGFTLLFGEGHVYKSAADVPHPLALRLYKNHDTQDILSTTDAPPAGYDDYLDDLRSNLIGFIAGVPELQ